MTTDQMRDAIEAVYGPALRERAGTFPLELPKGVTPQGWDIALPHGVKDLDWSEFDKRYAEPLGRVLAAAGTIQYDCNSFSRLRVQDRPEVQVRGQGGAGRPRKRDRQFIVHALGWKA